MNNINSHNAVVAIYKSHAEGEAAVKELQHSDFDMEKLSIVGRDYHTEEHVVGYYTTGDRMRYWGKQGAFWGGVWALLFGSAFFWIPGLGALLVAGPFVTLVIGALQSAVVVGGVTAIGAGLYSLGIPKDSIVRYETGLKSDKFVLIAHGTEEQMSQTREITTARTRKRRSSINRHACRIQPWCEGNRTQSRNKTNRTIMKNKTLVLTLLSIAVFAVACNKEQTTSEQLDKAQAKTKQAEQDMKDYTYAQKSTFVTTMEGQLAALNRDLDQLTAKVETSNATVKAEAKPKLQALRDQTAQLNKQLDEVRNATESTWDRVKDGFNKAYESSKDGFQQARLWVSQKIAP